MKISRILATLTLALLAAACASHDMDEDEMATVAGSITYLERVALGPEAVAHVRIVDLDLVDKPGYLVAQKTIYTPGQVPIAFELEYWMERVESGHTYAIQARLEEGGKVLFATPEDVKFDAKQPQRQELVLKRSE